MAMFSLYYSLDSTTQEPLQTRAVLTQLLISTHENGQSLCATCLSTVRGQVFLTEVAMSERTNGVFDMALPNGDLDAITVPNSSKHDLAFADSHQITRGICGRYTTAFLCQIKKT